MNVNSKSVIDDLVKDYLSDQRISQVSKKCYYNVLSLFFRWMHRKKIKINYLKRQHIIEYVDFIESTLQGNTARLYFVVLRSFFKWCKSKRHFREDITEGIRRPKLETNLIKRMPLNEEQLSSLYKLLSLDNPKNIRDTLIIELMLKYGLRRVEITRLNVGDIVSETIGVFMYVQSKGSKVRDSKMQLTPQTYKIIKLHLNNQPDKSEGSPLFTTFTRRSKGKRILVTSVSYIIKEYFERIGLNEEKYSAHSLRHTNAIMLIKMGMELHEVQARLRHKSITTTQLYIKWLNKQIALSNNIVKKLDEKYQIYA